MGSVFSFQGICKKIKHNCSRKDALELFCQFVRKLLESDPEGTVVIRSFFQRNIADNKNKRRSNDPLDRFMTRDTKSSVPKPLRECGNAFKQYLCSNDKINAMHFRKVQDAFLSLCGQTQAEAIVKSLMELYQDFPAADKAHLSLKKLAASDPEKALTWIVLFSLMPPFDVLDFAKYIENKKKAYEDCFAEKSSKYHITSDRLQEYLDDFFLSGSLKLTNHMPQGEDLLELIWKYADSQKKKSDKKENVCRKGLQYAKTLYGDSISMDIYPYVLDFHIEMINACWRKNLTEELKSLMTEAERLEGIRYDCTEEPDETKTDGVSITAKLRKAEGLFYSRYRDLKQCHKLDVEALALIGKKELSVCSILEKAKVINNRAIIFRKQYNLDKAIDWYLHSLEIKEEFKEEEPVSFTLAQSNFGIVLTLAHQFDKAERYLSDALETRRNLQQVDAKTYTEKVSISAYTLASYKITKAVCEHAMTFYHSTSLEIQWASEIADLLQESWKTFDSVNRLTEPQENMRFNHLMIEAVYLTLLSSLSDDARFCAVRTFFVQEKENDTSNKGLLRAAKYCFASAEKWITKKMNEEEQQAEYPQNTKQQNGNPEMKITYGDRRYGIFYMNAVIGRLTVSDALHGDAEKNQAEYQKITDYIANLMTDPSIAAEQSYITAAAFYGEFRMRHPELADSGNIIKILTDAIAAEDKLSKYGDKTSASLLPARNSLTSALTYLSGAANEIHAQNLTRLLPYLMMQL